MHSKYNITDEIKLEKKNRIKNSSRRNSHYFQIYVVDNLVLHINLKIRYMDISADITDIFIPTYENIGLLAK